ncbi:MAG: hypothetical protein MUD14_13650 [Hydrococcus sp. Prado102]|jgi:hypothetical protein|nr:hypothetical protein [Hydrococcus sp. Prado102]
MDIQIISAISGRLRLRIPRLNNDSNYADRVDGELKVLRFVTSVRINPLASSIAITYSTKTISETEAKKKILETIAQADHTIDEANLAVEESTPNNVVFLKFDSKSPDVQTNKTDKEIVAESQEAIEQPELVETTASVASLETSQAEELSETSAPESIALTQPQTTHQAEKLSPNGIGETNIPEPIETKESEAPLENPQMGEASPNEIASEQTSSNEKISPTQESASTSAGIEAQKNDTITHTVARVGETLKLNNLALARRLGVSAQALNVRSSQPDFTQWSMKKDPEQIGWVFIKSLKKFYSVNSV